jgi:hypothetical protein
MLVQFSISNTLSFKDKVTFSLLSAPIKERDERLSDNTTILKKNSLLKTAAIYGANASGKTNLIKGLQFFIDFILNRSNFITEKDLTGIVPFLLNTESKTKPSEFEIVILKDNIFFTYGFSLTSTEIVSESLTIRKERESSVFKREKGVYDIAVKYKIMNEITKRKMIPKNALLITKAAQFNESIAIEFLKHLTDLRIISGIDDFLYRDYTIEAINEDSFKNKIMELLIFADSTISGLETVNAEGEAITFQVNQEKANISREKKVLPDIFVKKRVYDNLKNPQEEIKFNMMALESEGTKKFFHISGPVIDCLLNGFTLFVDELDTKLHPLLVRKIVELFHNPKTNLLQAQLVFTTHNTTLLSLKTFRRDQIWLVEKNEIGESELYSLVDFKNGKGGIRNDESIEKNYLIGKYGAIPFLAAFDDFNLNEEII